MAYWFWEYTHFSNLKDKPKIVCRQGFSVLECLKVSQIFHPKVPHLKLGPIPGVVHEGWNDLKFERGTGQISNSGKCFKGEVYSQITVYTPMDLVLFLLPHDQVSSTTTMHVSCAIQRTYVPESTKTARSRHWSWDRRWRFSHPLGLCRGQEHITVFLWTQAQK